MTIDSKVDPADPAFTPPASDTTPLEPSTGLQRTRLLRLGQVMALVGLKKATIYQLLQKGEFPANVKITQRAVGWAEDDIQRWIAQRRGPRP